MLQRPKSISLSTLALAGFVLLIPFENWGTGLRNILLWAGVALLLWESREVLAAGFSAWGCTWKRPLAAGIIFTAIIAAITVSVAVMRWESSEVARLGLLAAQRVCLPSLAMPFLLALAAGQHARIALESPETRPLLRIDALACWIVAAWGMWMALASAYSIQPESSFKLIFREGGSFLVLLMLARLKIAAQPSTPHMWTRWIIGVGALVALVGIVEFTLAYAAPEPTRRYLTKKEFVRENPNAEGERVVRAQYPFDEHNRLGSYLLIIVVAIPLGFQIEPSRRIRIAYIAAAALAILAIIMTGTRGAMIAAGATLLFMIPARPKLILSILPVGLIVFLLLPGGIKRHVESIFAKHTYTEMGGNIQYRFRGWDIASEMIRERPVFGFGYGWGVYESIYPIFAEGKESYEKDMPHVHNNLLEVTVEMGLIGALIFCAYQIALLSMAFRLASASRFSLGGIPWAVFAMMIGVHIYGMANYSLRRTVGFEVFLIWGTAQALILVAAGSGSKAPNITGR